jgi:hypothetical protein
MRGSLDDQQQHLGLRLLLWLVWEMQYMLRRGFVREMQRSAEDIRAGQGSCASGRASQGV